MFDSKKPTVLLLGRWQPWHEGHLALFKRALAKTGQVVIQVRDVKDSSGGAGQEDNPFSFEQISEDISKNFQSLDIKLMWIILSRWCQTSLILPMEEE